jgi:flagellar operon protein
MSFRINRGQFIPPLHSIDTKSTKTNNKDFQKVLQDSIGKKEDKIKISAHAQQRINERHISLNDGDLTRLNQAMDTLEKKGAKESLMIYKDMAFIASVSNRTIITAMQNKEMEVVTNIDSAIVVK